MIDWIVILSAISARRISHRKMSLTIFSGGRAQDEILRCAQDDNSGAMMGIAEEVKELSEFVRKFNDIELNRRILSLENEVLDLNRDKRRLEQETEELKGKSKFDKEMKLNGRFYLAGEDSHPFCPACWDSRQQTVHVIISSNPRVDFICPSWCRHTYML